MAQLTEEESKELRGLVSEFNQAKIQIADAVIAQSNILSKIDDLKKLYSESELNLVKKYGKDAVINIETGEISEPQVKE
tara:strand:- start:8016 stop:8252 length:237 start_codon:yes stop_codon:yes gene_type:complete